MNKRALIRCFLPTTSHKSSDYELNAGLSTQSLPYISVQPAAS